MTSVFDRVVVTDGAAPRIYSRDEFVDLPIHVRVRYILERQVQFFLGVSPVDRAAALQGLRALTARKT